MSYFSNFPAILYSNVVVTDVTRRVVIPNSVLRQPTAFSPYTVEGGQREDTISFLYYGQDDDDWLINLANQIVDPYYGWFMDSDDFNEFVAVKYGSIPAAMQRVDHWLCNWASDYRNVSVGYYQALTPNLQKYWIPDFGAGAQVLSYSRRQEDWRVSTNQILDCTLPIPESPFQPGALLTTYDPNGTMQGTGELVWARDGVIRVKDVQGFWVSGYSVSDGVTLTQMSTVSLDPIMLIPIDEVVYFSPVSCYDAESDKNEVNKEVLLIQDSWRGIMYTELAQSLAAPVVG